MTVKELLKELNKLDADLPVFGFYDDDLFTIELVDDTFTDRVDLNLTPLEWT